MEYILHTVYVYKFKELERVSFGLETHGWIWKTVIFCQEQEIVLLHKFTVWQAFCEHPNKSKESGRLGRGYYRILT